MVFLSIKIYEAKDSQGSDYCKNVNYRNTFFLGRESCYCMDYEAKTKKGLAGVRLYCLAYLIKLPFGQCDKSSYANHLLVLSLHVTAHHWTSKNKKQNA